MGLTMSRSDIGLGTLVDATADSMRTAAANEGGMGAAMGYMGMNMANQAGAGLPQELAARQAAQAPSPMPQAAPAGSWTCACGQSGNTGNFCTACGRPKPQTAAAWTCPKCGQAGNTGNFCSNCGAPRSQVPANWTCPSCGTVNTGNFCMNCGAKKPER